MHAPGLFLSLPQGAHWFKPDRLECHICTEDAEIWLRNVPTSCLDAFGHVGAHLVREDDLIACVSEREGEPEIAQISDYLARLDRSGCLVRSVWVEDKCLATLVNSPDPSGLSSATPATSDVFLISRFAFLRRDSETLVLESAKSHARVALLDERVAALLGALGEPRTLAQLYAKLPRLTEEAVGLLVRLLIKGGMVVHTSEHNFLSEDDLPPLRMWSFHDLLFHSLNDSHAIGLERTRTGTQIASDCNRDVQPNLPTKLRRPALDSVGHNGAQLIKALERRCSIREYGSRPISADQVGEFLYRALRARDLPSPLHTYAVVDFCEDLESGLYSYDTIRHLFLKVCSRTVDVQRLLSAAKQSAGLAEQHLHVLLVMTALHDEHVPYAFWLRQVGVLFQHMYLVATIMGLAPCALGSGDSDAFARAAKLDYCYEPSVGEFLLGAQP